MQDHERLWWLFVLAVIIAICAANAAFLAEQRDRLDKIRLEQDQTAHRLGLLETRLVRK